MKKIDMICPQCGASLKPNIEKKEAVCAYCGYHMLIEREDTIEEIRAKEQAKSYGYHKGKLKAEAEARVADRGRRFSFLIPLAIVLVFVLIGFVSAVSQYLSKPQINPFDYIEVSFKGADGDGEAVLETLNVSEDVDINRVRFDISKDDKLLQGETITIQASSDVYRLSEVTKTYTVEGLDEYLKELENLSDEALELIHTRTESALKLNLDSSKESGILVDMKPVKIFLVTDGERTNCLYDVFEAHFATNSGEKIFYVMACFGDVIVRDGEQVSVSMSGGMYQGHITQVQGWLHIMAYDSLEEIRAELLTNQDSYMELKELDL